MVDSRPLALVLLVTLAGCTGALGPLGGAGDGGDTPLPPGVTADGVNATALLDAHVESIENRSFTLQYELSTDETMSDVVARAGSNHERVAIHIERDSETEGRFFTDDVRYEFIERDGVTNYYVVNQTESSQLADVQPYVRPDELRILLTQGKWTTDGTTDCEAGTCWVLTASSVDESGQLADAESFDGRAVVAPAGLVTHISVTLTREGTSGTATVNVSNVGDTVVTRPDWVSAANQSGKRIGFDQSPEPERQRIEREFDGQNGSVAILGAHEDADYGDLELRPVGIAPDNPTSRASTRSSTRRRSSNAETRRPRNHARPSSRPRCAPWNRTFSDAPRSRSSASRR
jgi:hypothetical protein